MCCASTKNGEKSLQEPFERHFSRQTCQNLVLGVPGLDFGGVSGPPGRLLGASWVALGRSWAAFGRSQAPLGSFLGISWVLLGASWLPDAAQDALGFDFESILVPPRPSLEVSWNVFRSIFSDASILYMSKFRHAFCEQTLDLYNALIAAENPCMVSPTIIFSPSGAAVCAQHIRRLPKGEPCVPDKDPFTFLFACL